MTKQDYYTDFFELGQQVINFNLYQIGLPEDDPVYTLKEIMEELNFDQLLKQYNSRGRKGFNPIMMYAIILYANMKGIRAVDEIVNLCERDICFMWLAQGNKPKRDAFYSFKNDKLTTEIMEGLHYQFIKLICEKGYVNLETLFVDGTKIEANANRYTFVWRGSINYHLVNLLDNIKKLYEEYNAFMEKEGYKEKYHIQKESMFIIEGTDRVKQIINENKKRKKLNKKKIRNNHVLKIDNIGPLQVMRIQKILKIISEKGGITFVKNKGKRKPEIQKLWEAFYEYGKRLVDYQEAFEIMGDDRNSYSKTDLDATFMRMKDDHMMNGQLKPGYNLQFAVDNYFIVHSSVSQDRTDYSTLIPLIDNHYEKTGIYLKELVADSGYCSEANLSYIKKSKIDSFIKLQEHEIKKTKKYKNDISKYYNMDEIHEIENGQERIYYICHDGRKLHHIKTEKRTSKGFDQLYEVYACESCQGCEHKTQCLYKYDEKKHKDKNKVMKINRYWDELKKESETNIHTEKGIKYRQIRSVQTEGAFGDMKENDDFRRFNYRTQEKVYKETLLYVMGRNFDKYHRFKNGLIERFEGKVA